MIESAKAVCAIEIRSENVSKKLFRHARLLLQKRNPAFLWERNSKQNFQKCAFFCSEPLLQRFKHSLQKWFDCATVLIGSGVQRYT